MRKLIAALLVGALSLPTLSASAAPTVTIQIDGAPWGAPAPVTEGVIMVPLRAFAETLGAQVHWDEESAIVTYGARTLRIRPDDPMALVNGQPTVLPQPAYLQDGRLIVPLQSAAQALRAEVRWDVAAGVAQIRTNVGGTITMAALEYVDHLIPFGYPNPLADPITALIYDPLLRPDGQMNLHPALAESYSIEGDRTYLFHLRKDVTWHDGRPFTATDVAFTLHLTAHPDGFWQRLPSQVKGLTELVESYFRDPGTADSRAERLEAWERWRHTGGIQVRDPYTVAVELTEPHAPALTALATTRIIPAHLFKGEVPHPGAAAPWQPIGTGPYRLIEWKSDERIVLTRNPDWRWGVLGQPSRIGRIIIRLFPDDEAIAAALADGLIDVAPLTAAQARQIQASRLYLRVVEHPTTSYTYLGYNLHDPILSDLSIRQAITLAIDQQQVIADALGGHGTPALSHTLAGRWDMNTSLTPPRPDLEAAAALLDKAGWQMGENAIRVKDGRPLAIEISTNDTQARAKAAHSIQRQLAPLGVDVTVIVMEWNSFLDYVMSNRKQAYVLGWNVGTDPDPFIQFHTNGGFQPMHNYENPAVDALIEQAQRSLNQVARAKYYRELWHILHQDQVHTWLYFGHNMFGFRERVQGVMVDTIGHLDPRWHLDNWWVTEP